MKREEAQKKRRALVYARVSKAEMVNAEFCSLDGQQERCESYAKAFGWDVVDRFRDASTGGNTERPDLQRLLERIAERDCDTLLVYKIDRLSRSVLDFWQL
ncbi:MAG: recombinase family protein, partial [Planctomycetes bacterium]|nr:recombinase family protein [Planctomycetota bacterium]